MLPVLGQHVLVGDLVRVRAVLVADFELAAGHLELPESPAAVDVTVQHAEVTGYSAEYRDDRQCRDEPRPKLVLPGCSGGVGVDAHGRGHSPVVCPGTPAEHADERDEREQLLHTRLVHLTSQRSTHASSTSAGRSASCPQVTTWPTGRDSAA